MNKKQERRLDMALLVVFPVLATLISLATQANFLVSTLLYFLPLMIFLSNKNKKAIVKTALFSFVVALPFYIVVDYVGIMGGAWYVPESMFSWRLFGIAPIEDFIWGFCLLYSVVIFYEYFYDKTGREKLSKNLRKLVLLLGIVVLFFMIFLLLNPSILTIPYIYLILGLIFIILPLSLVLYYAPKLAFKFFKTGIYFAFLSLLLELVGVHLNQWIFPGNHFIGWFELFGLRFPLEEFFFFIVFGAAGFLALYEFFDDDMK